MSEYVLEEDIPKALKFSELKKYTGLNVSFNIFNSTNYSSNELLKVSKLVQNTKLITCTLQIHMEIWI